jgi:hypothetical protein
VMGVVCKLGTVGEATSVRSGNHGGRLSRVKRSHARSVSLEIFCIADRVCRSRAELRVKHICRSLIGPRVTPVEANCVGEAYVPDVPLCLESHYSLVVLV